MPSTLSPDDKRKRPSVISRVRSNFLAGLVIIAPIALTFWLIWTVVGWIDGWVWPFVPRAYQPEELINRWFSTGEHISVNVRGIGVMIFFLFTMLIGFIGKGIMGRSMLKLGENIVGRMPVVRSIYNGVKQIAETVFSQRETSFDKACLIEYPRKGIWAVAFIATNARDEVKAKLPGNGDIATVFLPTTPNPTSGFLLFLPREDVLELDMTVEDAAKLVISAGLVYPNGQEAAEALTPK